MKSLKRPQGYKLWRAGHLGFRKLQDLVDRLILVGEAETDDTDARRLAVALADTKIKLNKEARENAVTELRYRREKFELDDAELAHKNQSAYLLKVKAEIEKQLQTLLQLNDLSQVLPSLGAATMTLESTSDDPAADDNSKPDQTVAPEGPTESSEGALEDEGGESKAGETEGLSDQTSDTETK